MGQQEATFTFRTLTITLTLLGYRDEGGSATAVLKTDDVSDNNDNNDETSDCGSYSSNEAYSDEDTGGSSFEDEIH